jgi:hypothetical protein
LFDRIFEMLTLSRELVEISDGQKKELIKRLSLDVEKDGYLPVLDRLFKEELIIKKPWIGSTVTSKIHFSIRRTRIGIFKHQSSMITVKSNELENSNHSNIQISYGITWFTAINFLMLGVIIFMFAYLLSNDIWGWIIGLGVFIIELLYCVIELNKTQEKFKIYLDS